MGRTLDSQRGVALVMALGAIVIIGVLIATFHRTATFSEERWSTFAFLGMY